MSRVLVTGGAGFIGSHTVERLVQAGHEVVVLDDFSAGSLTNLRRTEGRIALVRGDVRDPACVFEAAKGAEIILHTAAIVSVPRSIERPLETHDVNVRGTLTVLEAARAGGVRRVVLASSAAVYGDRGSDGPLAPRSPYGAEKAIGETYARLYGELHGLETVVLRYFNVFGPRQDARSTYAGVLSIFAARLARGDAVTVFGDGDQSRDFVYVSDVAEANLRAATMPSASGQTFDIGRGTATSLNDVLRELGDLVGRHPEVRRLPARQGDIRHSLASIGAAHDKLGYSPAVTLREGLAKLLAGAS